MGKCVFKMRKLQFKLPPDLMKCARNKRDLKDNREAPWEGYNTATVLFLLTPTQALPFFFLR